MSIERRQFVAGCISASGLAALGNCAMAVEPMRRSGDAPLRLSLSAYSLRSQMSRPAQSTDALNLSGFIQYCAKLGVDAAELTQYYFPEDTTREYLFDLKRQAHIAGLDISGGAIGNNFTVEPGAELDQQHAYVETWINHYADLGAPVIRVFAGKPAAQLSADQATRRAIAALERASEVAGSRGVMLAIENHDFTTNVDRLLEIVKSVKSPWFGVNFDSGNLSESEDPYADMERMAGYAVNAQLKVTINCAAGKQQADFARIVRLLHDSGYRGYVALEYEESDDPYVAIPRYVSQLREVLAAVS